jgi:hypothetical protein
MQRGGELKGSMNLPKSEKIDCRKRIARAAGVADDQVSKVEKILRRGNEDLLEALRAGEVTILRASSWLNRAEPIADQLALHRTQRGIARTVNLLLRRHHSRPKATQGNLDVKRIGKALAAMDPVHRANIVVASFRAPGQFLLLSEQLLHNLENKENPIYDTD